jgi:outer membrane protein TolC
MCNYIRSPRTRITALSLLFLSGTLAFGGIRDTTNSEFRLPPVSRLQELAVANSSLLKRETASVNKYGAELSRQSKEWMRGVTFEGASQYGSYGDQTVNQLYLGNRVGLSIKISLYDFLASGNTTDMYKFQMEETERNREAIEKEIRLSVISRYNAVMLAYNSLRLTAEGEETAHANAQIAEQEFKRGEVPLSEYSRVVQIATEAALKAESARSSYREQYALLQEFVGVNLQSEGAK